jgi:hypothetical protein
VSDSEEIERWTRALDELVPVPAEHAEPALPLPAARDFLRCSEPVFEALRRAGLPVHEGRLDRIDLINLALRSGSGRSVPEIGLRHSFRFVGQDEAAWCERRRWRFSCDLACSSPAAEGGEAKAVKHWKLWPPLSWPAKSEPARGALELSGRRATAAYEVATAGLRRSLSRQLRELVEEYLGERRFARMPFAVQLQGESMAEWGLFDCFSGSVELERRCGEAGIEARVRQGWLFGQTASEHAWLEVVDRDGEHKDVDPAFFALAQMLYPSRGEFREFCLGSRLNRVLATECPPTEQPLRHLCAAPAGEVAMEVSIASADRG